jgi:bacillolysin
MRSRTLFAISASAVLVTSTGLVTASTSSASPQRTAATPGASNYTGSFAISGKSAAAYVVPDDVTQVWSSRRPDGTTQTRYQQRVGSADVFGGQVTVLKNAAGRTTSVVGAYLP